MNKLNRWIPVSVALGVLAIGGVAYANEAKPMCGGRGGHGGGGQGNPQAHFQAKDKNHDGFLTADEVKPKRWEHIQVADANGDKKVSFDELQKAHESGKLVRPRRGHGKNK